MSGKVSLDGVIQIATSFSSFFFLFVSSFLVFPPFPLLSLLILRLHCIGNNVLCVYSFYYVYIYLVFAEGLPEGIKPSIWNASRILYSGVYLYM